jgi:hypothetical protein
MAIKVNSKELDGDVEMVLSEALIVDYFETNKRIKILNERLTKMKDDIKKQLMVMPPTDDKGNVVIEVAGHVVKLEARTAMSLNEQEAESWLKAHRLWDKVKVETIDHDKFEKLVINGNIPPEVMQELAVKNVTRALKIT